MGTLSNWPYFFLLFFLFLLLGWLSACWLGTVTRPSGSRGWQSACRLQLVARASRPGVFSTVLSCSRLPACGISVMHVQWTAWLLVVSCDSLLSLSAALFSELPGY